MWSELYGLLLSVAILVFTYLKAFYFVVPRTEIDKSPSGEPSAYFGNFVLK